MDKQALLEHLDCLIEQADLMDIGFRVIREHLDEIHEHIDQLEKRTRSTEETPEQE